MKKSDSRKVFACVVAVTALFGACDDSSSKKASCSSSALEADLEATPFMGPGVDPASGALKLTAGKQYMVSATYGVPVPGTDGAPVTAEYETIFQGVAEQLMHEPGLVGFKLASSDACASGRTLAVWESEEAMYAFVTSPAHLLAMQRVDAILQPGYGVTHWTANAREEMSFEEGVKRLAAE